MGWRPRAGPRRGAWRVDLTAPRWARQARSRSWPTARARPAARGFSRGYLRYLLRAKELTGMRPGHPCTKPVVPPAAHGRPARRDPRRPSGRGRPRPQIWRNPGWGVVSSRRLLLGQAHRLEHVAARGRAPLSGCRDRPQVGAPAGASAARRRGRAAAALTPGARSPRRAAETGGGLSGPAQALLGLPRQLGRVEGRGGPCRCLTGQGRAHFVFVLHEAASSGRRCSLTFGRGPTRCGPGPASDSSCRRNAINARCPRRISAEDSATIVKILAPLAATAAAAGASGGGGRSGWDAAAARRATGSRGAPRAGAGPGSRRVCGRENRGRLGRPVGGVAEQPGRGP